MFVATQNALLSILTAQSDNILFLSALHDVQMIAGISGSCSRNVLIPSLTLLVLGTTHRVCRRDMKVARCVTCRLVQRFCRCVVHCGKKIQIEASAYTDDSQVLCVFNLQVEGNIEEISSSNLYIREWRVAHSELV